MKWLKFTIFIVQHKITYAGPIITTLCERNNPCIKEATCKIDPAAPIVGKPQCICPEGDGLIDGTGCRDIDDCLTGSHSCNVATEICVNTNGAHHCECKQGYERKINSDVCQDINECVKQNPCGTADAVCHNLDGGYLCSCNDKTKVYQNGICKDRDYCNENDGIDNPCDKEHGICLNRFHVAECICENGFKLGADGFTCHDVDECVANSHNCSSVSTCINTIGSFYCKCNELDGWENQDNYTCINLNECIKYPDVCPNGHDCCVDLMPPRKYLCTSLIKHDEDNKRFDVSSKILRKPRNIVTIGSNEISKRLGSLPILNQLQSLMVPSLRRLDTLQEAFFKRSVETAGHVLPIITGIDAGSMCLAPFIDVRPYKRQAILMQFPDFSNRFLNNLQAINPFNGTALNELNPTAISTGVSANIESILQNMAEWYKIASSLPGQIDNSTNQLSNNVKFLENLNGFLNILNKASAPIQEAIDVARALNFEGLIPGG